MAYCKQVDMIELCKAERLHGLPPASSAWIAWICSRKGCSMDSMPVRLVDAMSQITHLPVKEALQHLEALYSDCELRLMAERRERAVIDELDALDSARTEGLRQGREEGLLQGQALVLDRLLTHRFGTLSASIRQRLSSASSRELDVWALNVLDADTLENVFQQPR